MSRMLSNFVPSTFSKFIGAKRTENSEVINRVVEEIKEIGRSNIDDHNTSGIDRLLSLMRRYQNILAVQRVGCHSISNLAMQVVAARWVVQKGGFSVIKRAIEKFITDEKLCWLGSSAVWNLARPPSNRPLIGNAGVNLMVKLLQSHSKSVKVVNTTIGALSNLSLCDDLKSNVANESNILLLYKVFEYFVIEQENSMVATSAAGLFANLAVSDELGNEILKKDFLRLLLNILEWQTKEESDNDDNLDITLYRNVCAALNNLITSKNFVDQIITNHGIETIYNFLDQVNNDLLTNLLENCLIHLECDPQTRTTSLHLSSLHNRLNILKSFIKNDNNLLNACDDSNATCLDYAIAKNHLQIITFLCRCGANTNNITQVLNEDVETAIQLGENELKNIKNDYNIVTENALNFMPIELCHLIINQQNVIDLLEGVNKF